MYLVIDGEKWFIDTDRIKDDLRSADTELVCISKHGEMVIDCNVRGKVRREVWQACPDGHPSPCLYVGGMSFEYTRTVPFMTECKE
jgi:hypothetical protein